jgi:hypothetical protein
MPGTAKLWWHDGSTRDARYHPTPLINEPEIGFETLALSAAPAATGAAPEHAHVAVLETDVAIRYLVRAPGDMRDATAAEAKPLAATGSAVATIGVRPGYTLSIREV